MFVRDLVRLDRLHLDVYVLRNRDVHGRIGFCSPVLGEDAETDGLVLGGLGLSTCLFAFVEVL